MRQYKLGYDPGTGRGEAYLLESVQQCDAANVCLPPTTFQYDDGIPAGAPVLEALPEPVVPGASIVDLIVPGTNHYAHVMRTPPMDLNGDGIDDFLYTLSSEFEEERNDYQYDLVALLSNGQVGAASHDYVHTGITVGYLWAYYEPGALLLNTRNVSEQTIASSEPLGFFDYNNDGRTDVLFATRYGDEQSRYRILSFNGHGFDYIDTGRERDWAGYEPNTYILDVNGDGFKDVLECAPDSPNTDVASFAPVWRLNLNSQGTGYGPASTFFVLSDAPCRKSSLVLDANGDGREELLIKLRETDPGPNSSDGQISIVEPDPPSMLMFFNRNNYTVSYLETNASMGLNRDQGHPALADVNGDGLLDVLGWSTRRAQSSGRIWISVSVNRGDGRFSVAEQSLGYDFASLDEHSRRHFMNSGHALLPTWLQARVVDVDRDGKQDLVGRFGASDVYFSGGHLYNRTADLGLMDESYKGPEGRTDVDYDRDYDRDGWPELSFRTSGRRRDPGTPAGFRVLGEARPKLRNIVDGYGALVTVSYGLLSDPAVHQSELYEADGSVACAYPFVCGLNKSSVVTSSLKEEGAGGSQRWEYSYEGARTGAEGRGFLGFSSRTVNEKTLLEDVSTTVYAYDNRSRNDLNDFPFAFLPFSRVTYTHLPSSEYVESEHRAYVSTYPYRATVSGRLVGTHAPLATVTTRDVIEISDAGPLILAHERDEVTLYDHVYGNVTAREQQLSANETRYQLTGYLHLVDQDFADAWLISQPAFHDDRYIYEGKQEVAKSSGFAYYPNGKLSSRNEETGLTRSWKYNAHGGVTEEQQVGTEGTRIQRVDWDALDEYPIKITNAEGHETDLEYDRRFGQVAWTRDPNELLTTLGYDTFGRLKAVSRPDGSSESFSYLAGDAALPLVVEQRAATGERILTAYDLGGRPTERTTWDLTGKELVESVGYDTRGRVHASTLPTTPTAGAPLIVATTEYDNLDRPVFQQGPEGNTRSCYRGLVMCTEDGRRSTSCNVRDVRGRVAWVTKPVLLGCEAAMESLFSLDGVGYTYQAFDLLHEVTENGRTTTITVDSSGRKIASDDPDRGDEAFRYTTFGELREYTNGDGEISSFYYDDLGRITERRDWAGVVGGAYERSAWEWDGGSSLGAGELLGSLTSSESSDDVVRSYRYNARGLLEQEMLAIDGDSFSTTMTWDPFGRLNSVQYPARDGVTPFTLGYEYAPSASGSGVLKSVHNLSSAYGNEVYWTAVNTDPHGRLAAEVMGNGGSRSRTWYSSGRVETLTTRASGGAIVQQMGYLYDAVGNLEAQNDAVGELSGLFDYDASNRLRVELTSAPRFYDYDPDGNLVQPGFEYEDAQPHALSSDGTFAYDYDGAGRRYLKRRADGSGQEIEYTRFDLPRAVHRLAAGGAIASTVTLSYDANGSRVRKRSPDEEVTYSGGFEYRRFFDGRPAEQVFYVGNGGEVVAQVTAKSGSAPSTAYLHNSRLGTVAAVEEGGATSRIRQDAFGMPISVEGSTNPWSALTSIGFTGHETDSELELINMSGRIYDPRARQFLTTDPIVSAPYLSLDLNPYAYAWGNPLKYIDPTGLQEAGALDEATIESVEGVEVDAPIVVSVPRREPASDAVTSPLGSEGFGDRVPLDASQLGAHASNHETLRDPYEPPPSFLHNVTEANPEFKDYGNLGYAYLFYPVEVLDWLGFDGGQFGPGAPTLAIGTLKYAAKRGAVNAAKVGVGFGSRLIGGTRGLRHSFDRHAAEWFGGAVSEGTHLAKWETLVQRAAGSGKQLDWVTGADATVGHLARIDGKYLFAQFYTAGSRAGELATAFVPSQQQLTQILMALGK